MDDAVLADISSADLPSLCPLTLSCVMYERAGELFDAFDRPEEAKEETVLEAKVSGREISRARVVERV